MLTQNYEEASQAFGGGSGSQASSLLEFISDGRALYTKGSLFFPKYYSVAFTMLK